MVGWRWLIASWVVVGGCGEPGSVELSVDLITDFVAGAEFVGVRVTVLDTGATMESLSGNESYVSGRRVFELGGLPPLERRVVRLELLDGARRVVTVSELPVRNDEDAAMQFLIARSCANVTCGAGTTCRGGRCVDVGCVDGTEPSCEEPDCATAVDCPALAECSEPTCVAGVCLYETAAPCEEGFFCVPETGCEPNPGVPADMSVAVDMRVGEDAGVDAGADAGMDSAVMPDAGPGLRAFADCAISTSRAELPTPSIPEPGYLSPILDPTFGARVTRVTGDPGTPVGSLPETWVDVARHGWVTRPAWNADASLIFIGRNVPVFLDGTTYQPVSLVQPPVSISEGRWHPSRPSVRVWVDGDTLGEWNVRTNAITVLRTFPGYDDLSIGPLKANLTDDGSMVALVGTAPGGAPVVFAYDIGMDFKHPDIPLGGVTDFDWAGISPLGTYVVVHGWGQQTQVYDLMGNEVGARWTTLGRPSNFDLSIDSVGDEVAVGVSQNSPDTGRVIKRRLRDGAVTVLTHGGFASDVSTRNLDLPGWAFVTYNYRGSSFVPYRDEMVAVPLDGSQQTRRLAHLHAGALDSEGRSHGVPSPDGRRVLFASDWDQGPRPVRAYVIDTEPLCR